MYIAARLLSNVELEIHVSCRSNPIAQASVQSAFHGPRVSDAPLTDTYYYTLYKQVRFPAYIYYTYMYNNIIAWLSKIMLCIFSQLANRSKYSFPVNIVTRINLNHLRSLCVTIVYNYIICLFSAAFSLIIGVQSN